MPLAPLGLNLLEAPPHANPSSSRSCFPPAVGWVLAPRPSPRPKPLNQLLPLGFSAVLPQRRTPDSRDFPSRESVRLLVVLPTVQGRSSSRFPYTHEHPSEGPAGSTLGPGRDWTATTEAVTVSSLPSREIGMACRADSLRNLLGEPQQGHRPPGVLHGLSSSDEPRLTHRLETLEAQPLSACKASCEVSSPLHDHSLRTFSWPGARLDSCSRSHGRLFAPRP